MREEKPHRRLEARTRGMELVIVVYRLTAQFPSHERYALVDQMRKAAASVPSNVSEGAARHTKKEFAQFLHMTRGSLSELDTQLEIALRLGYVPSDAVDELQARLDRVGRLVTGLIRSLGGRQ